jgi:hypothetical protein
LAPTLTAIDITAAITSSGCLASDLHDRHAPRVTTLVFPQLDAPHGEARLPPRLRWRHTEFDVPFDLPLEVVVKLVVELTVHLCRAKQRSEPKPQPVPPFVDDHDHSTRLTSGEYMPHSSR